MKKQTAMALAAVFAMSVAGTALAAPANPFVDVPAKHWAYDSINKLAKAGVISGYGDGTFKGEKTLTRYEVAVIVAKAMASSSKMDAETQKALDSLKAEFGAELNNLGVRMDNVEKKLDNVKVTGDVRMRYEHTKSERAGANETSSITSAARNRVAFTGTVDDQWSFTARVQNTSKFRNPADTDSKTEFNQAYATGKIFGGTYTVGRQDVFILDGLLVDNTADSDFRGATVAYKLGNFDVAALTGQQAYTHENASHVDETKYATLNAFQVNTKAGSINLGAAYAQLKDVLEDGSATVKLDDINFWQVMAGTKLSPVFGIDASYAKSNADDDNKAYTFRVNYKEFDKTQAGSFGAWATYRHTEANSVPMSTWDVVNINGGGAKTYEVGFDYAPWKNIQLETYYTVGQSIKNSNDKDKYLCSYVRFYF